MAKEFTGEALDSKISGTLNGPDVRAQGRFKNLLGAAKRFAVIGIIAAVAGMSMPSTAQAGFLDDLVDKATTRVEQSIKGSANRTIGNIERNIERGVQNQVNEAIGKSVQQKERDVRNSTGVQVDVGSRTIRDVVNTGKSVFKLPRTR